MQKFAVWAPKVKELLIEVAGNKYALQKEARGKWILDLLNLLQDGTDYSLYLDGEGPFADPKSYWQPKGAMGPSRWINHQNFKWEDVKWQPPLLSSAIIYELHTGTFSEEGTLTAIIKYLDYFLELGVTHIELMPVNGIPGKRGWGYDGVNLYAVYEIYGGPFALKKLVNECHRKGLSVILDVVYNHLGPEGNFLEKFGPYFKESDSTPWGKAINFDKRGSDFVRNFFINNALMWLRDYHIDALRIDAVHAFIDLSAKHFLQELMEAVQALSIELEKKIYIIAESDLNDARIIRSPLIGGYGINAQWNDDFHHSVHTLLTGEKTNYYQDFGSIQDLQKVYSNAFVYDGIYSAYRDRTHGNSPTPASGSSGINGNNFIAYIQNHDQVGNRGAGERLNQLVSVDYFKIASALLFTSPFIPLIFQGEEWAASTPFLFFTDYEDHNLGVAVKEGRQKEFPTYDPNKIPDPQALETFLNSKLKWEEKNHGEHALIWKWYKNLIKIRKNYPELRDGNFKNIIFNFHPPHLPANSSDHIQDKKEERWITIERGRTMVVVYLSASPIHLQLKNNFENLYQILLTSSGDVTLNPSGVYFPHQGVAILALKTNCSS